MDYRLRIKPGLLERLRNLSEIKSDDAQARMLGVDRSTINRIKNGEQPSGKFMATLCTTYGLGLGEAFEIYESAEEAVAA